MTSDFCFVDIMEATILKILLAGQRFSHFFMIQWHVYRETNSLQEFLNNTI